MQKVKIRDLHVTRTPKLCEAVFILRRGKENTPTRRAQTAEQFGRFASRQTEEALKNEAPTRRAQTAEQFGRFASRQTEEALKNEAPTRRFVRFPNFFWGSPRPFLSKKRDWH